MCDQPTRFSIPFCVRRRPAQRGALATALAALLAPASGGALRNLWQQPYDYLDFHSDVHLPDVVWNRSTPLADEDNSRKLTAYDDATLRQQYDLGPDLVTANIATHMCPPGLFVMRIDMRAGTWMLGFIEMTCANADASERATVPLRTGAQSGTTAATTAIADSPTGFSGATGAGYYYIPSPGKYLAARLSFTPVAGPAGGSGGGYEYGYSALKSYTPLKSARCRADTRVVGLRLSAFRFDNGSEFVDGFGIVCGEGGGAALLPAAVLPVSEVS
ncbi:hypothetical protein JKP88DRAFT_254364 [Tribonema minus]|uniref:Uncharacterized protein n=1 Tax=Tribonema minus TaxID=303371 RepID=A0A835Z5C7_9STRA|nr:hypothetical protein JKP88DRAFT_254364 [Tribonema minus]